MEETSTTPSNSEYSNKPSSRSRIVLFLLLPILVISILINVYLYTNSGTSIGNNINKSNKNLNNVPQINKWGKLESNAQGYPIAKVASGENTRKLFIYSLTKNELEDLGVQIDGGGGGAGSGVTDPTPSPNLYYTTYIDRSTNDLWLVSNDTLEKRQITNDGHVSYISGWSPDSKSVVYRNDDINFQGIGSPQSQKYDPTLLPGFHLFNIETGKDTYLYPITSFEKFIDNDNIMVRSNDEPDIPYIFNISGFKSDRDRIKDTFGYGTGQFNFSPDGKKWTFILSTHPTDDNSIVYADFPSKKGITIDSGGWTDTQWPIISPGQDKIVYQRQEGFVAEGEPKFTVWIYDINSKNKKKYMDGSPETWAGNDKVIVRNGNGKESINDSDYYILDLKSGQQTKIN